MLQMCRPTPTHRESLVYEINIHIRDSTAQQLHNLLIPG